MELFTVGSTTTGLMWLQHLVVIMWLCLMLCSLCVFPFYFRSWSQGSWMNSPIHQFSHTYVNAGNSLSFLLLWLNSWSPPPPKYTHFLNSIPTTKLLGNSQSGDLNVILFLFLPISVSGSQTIWAIRSSFAKTPRCLFWANQLYHGTAFLLPKGRTKNSAVPLIVKHMAACHGFREVRKTGISKSESILLYGD